MIYFWIAFGMEKTQWCLNGPKVIFDKVADYKTRENFAHIVHLIERISLERRMKILLILALGVVGGSAHFSRFYPYWVEKELDLPLDEPRRESSHERQISQPSKTRGPRQISEQENAEALYSLLNRQTEPRQR